MTTLTKEKPAVIPLPDAELLWELFNYDPINGVLIWRVSTSSRAQVGDIAGYVNSEGYRIIGINKVTYQAHRLICKWVSSEDPGAVVEHKDDNPLNNCFWNLIPDSTQRANMQTRLMNSQGECRGYCLRPNGKYDSAIAIQGTHYYLGRFDTEEEASQAYNNALERVTEDPNWRPPPPVYTSKYRWVHWDESRGKWHAAYTYKGERFHVGRFEDEYDAYMAAVSHRAHNPVILDSMIENFAQTGDALSAPSVPS